MQEESHPSDSAFNEIGEFLAALVRIPSVNPPGGEGRVAVLMEERLGALGCETEVVEAAPGRPSVIARLPGSGGGPTLLLNGHMDVQPPGTQWLRDPFGAEIAGTRLYGQGSMDMKAGLAAIVFALQLLQSAGTRLAGDLVVTAVADEVCGGHLGTGYLVDQGIVHADMAVVCEPTGDVVRVAHRGALWLEVEVLGRSAHGGRPWLGVNAIGKLARIITAIEDDLLPQWQSRTHPLLPAPTVNLGTLHGGTKFNLVADRAILQIDRRTLPGEAPDAVQAEIEALCESVRIADSDDWNFEIRRVMYVSPGEIDPAAPIVQACMKAHLAETGEEAQIGPVGDKVKLGAAVEVLGRSAHGGRPWLGVNAIGKLARIITAIEDDLLPQWQSRTHPLLPAPTVNLGTLHGGTKFNLVADRAILQIDRRTLPGEAPDAVQAEIEALCESVRIADSDDWNFEIRRVMYVSPGEIDPAAPIVQACMKAHLAETGEEAQIGATAGFEDAHFLLDAGIPTAMYGPYRRTEVGEDPFYTNSGMADESVDLRDVARAGRVYARLITDILG